MNLIRLRLAALFAALAIYYSGTAGHFHIVFPFVGAGWTLVPQLRSTAFHHLFIFDISGSFAAVNADKVFIQLVLPGNPPASAAGLAQVAARHSLRPIVAGIVMGPQRSADLTDAAVVRKTVSDHFYAFSILCAAAHASTAVPDMSFCIADAPGN